MFCKECGTKHPSFVNYCPNDGQELAPALLSAVNQKTEGYCAGCGNSVISPSQYCQYCGDSHSTLKAATPKKLDQSIAHPKAGNITKVKVQPFSSKTFTIALFALCFSIFLVVITAFLLKMEVETAIIENADEEITRGQLHSLENYIASEFENEYEISLDLPNIYNIFTYIALMHSIDFELTGEAAEENSDFFQFSLDVDAQNFSAQLLLLTFVILMFSGVALGYFAKKNYVPVWQAVLNFSILYGLFIAISSYIASFEYANNIDSAFADVSINFIGKFPLFESFFSGLILALAISGSASIFSVYRNETFNYLRTKASYLQYLATSIFIMLSGLFSLAALSFVGLSTSPASDELFETFDLASVTLFGSFSIWIWDLAHMLPIHLSMREFGENESYTFHLLQSLSDNQNEIINLFFFTETFPLWVKLSFILPAGLLMTAGYLLYTTHFLKLVELLKFAAFYGFLMVIIKLFTSLKLFFSGSSFGVVEETINVQIHSDLFSVFLISTIYALIFFGAGGFLKRYLTE